MKKAFLSFLLMLTCASLWAQCEDCTPDPECTTDVPFPTICPLVFPDGTTGEYYSEVLTFYLPSQVVDPETEIEATLEQVIVTNISGMPFGMEITLDDEDQIYLPSDGQESGCGTLCGTPLIAGEYEILVEVDVVVEAFGFEQTVAQAFTLPLSVLQGTSGNSLFSVDQSAGCGSVSVTPEIILDPGSGEVSYDWVYGNGGVSEMASPGAIDYDSPGDYNLSLQLQVQQYILTSANIIVLSGGWGGDLDDGFGLLNPDPYFVIYDANNQLVYTSSAVTDNETPSWDNLSVTLENGPFTIEFWDSDGTLTEDDYLGQGQLDLATGTIVLEAEGTTCSFNIELQTTLDITESETISVFEVPSTEIQISNNGDLLYSNQPNMSSYLWTLNGDTIVSNNDSLSMPAPGFYELQVTNEFGCESAWATYLLCPSMQIDLVNGNLVATPGFDEYQWEFNGLPLDGESGSSLSNPAEGNYSVSGTTDTGCDESSEVITITNIHEATDLVFQMYPNPAESILNVEHDGSGTVEFRVMDMKGAIVGQYVLSSSVNRLDVSGLAPGLYQVSLITENSRSHSKQLLVGVR
ncbi:MAG: T9SS type A sorting domain-containing protein [Bacteroidota bacterium]